MSENLSICGSKVDKQSNSLKVKGDMQEERQHKILEILKNKKYAGVDFLSRELFVSKPTVRRDLKILADKNLIKRSFGGAAAIGIKDEIPIEIRNTQKSKEKEALSKAAAKLIKDGDTVFLDASTTTLPITHYMKDYKNITVVTNSLQVLCALKDSAVKVYSTGGSLIKNSYSFCGALAENSLGKLNIDICFFSSYSINENGTVSDYSERETSARAAALSRSKKKVFMFDLSKFGRDSAFVLTDINNIDYIITDKKDLPPAFFRASKVITV